MTRCVGRVRLPFFFLRAPAAHLMLLDIRTLRHARDCTHASPSSILSAFICPSSIPVLSRLGSALSITMHDVTRRSMTNKIQGRGLKMAEESGKERAMPDSACPECDPPLWSRPAAQKSGLRLAGPLHSLFMPCPGRAWWCKRLARRRPGVYFCWNEGLGSQVVFSV